MQIGGEGQRDLRKPVAAGALTEGKRNGNIRAFQQPLTLTKKPFDQTAEARSGGMKGSADGIGGHLLHLTGDDRREQAHKSPSGLGS